MRREFGEEELPAEVPSGPGGCSIAPPGPRDGRNMEELHRLTHYKNRAGDVTSSLAWDDLTVMRLEAGKVVEARAKEVT